MVNTIVLRAYSYAEPATTPAAAVLDRQIGRYEQQAAVPMVPVQTWGCRNQGRADNRSTWGAQAGLLP